MRVAKIVINDHGQRFEFQLKEQQATEYKLRFTLDPVIFRVDCW